MKNNFLNGVQLLFRKKIEPIFYARRLKKRLHSHGKKEISDLPSVELRLNPGNCCSNFCVDLTNSYGHNLQNYMRSGVFSSNLNSRSLLLHAIDLGSYADYQIYLNELKKGSNFFFRQTRSSASKGYEISQFLDGEFLSDIDDIFSSMKMRSFGPVAQAFFRNFSKSKEGPLREHESASMQCCTHWEVLFGVFGTELSPRGSEGNSSKRLVCFARLHRIGNVISYKDLIGHGAHLKFGVTKLLHTEIVKWILDSGDIRVQGIEYLVHGSLQRGGEGFFFWKKKALFKPHLISLINGPD